MASTYYSGQDEEDDDSLKSTALLPRPFHSVFQFRYFNAVQSETFKEAFQTDDNMVIAAPTGSGKTVLFELGILRMLSKGMSSKDHYAHTPGKKVVYVAPMKALVQEKQRDWGQKFGTLGLKSKELSGDSEITSLRELQDADIILTTPEKFDSITRRFRDVGGLSLFADVALLLIDEVHLLSDPRGAALEAIVSRLKMLARYPEVRGCPITSIRFIAVSATIPNIDDIATWIGAKGKGIRSFGEEMRPVKLTTTVLGYAPAKNDFLFEKRLLNFLHDIILQHNDNKPALVFCSTRKGAQDAAVMLANQTAQPGARSFVKSQQQYDRLQSAALTSTDKHLQQCIRQGVGFHNGGLDLANRGLVESLFARMDLQIVCTTNTLAQGVNLPAHLVVVMSTQFYDKTKGGYCEYERSAILQMAGRAGRPQFDEFGQVVIMTRRETVHLYETLLSGAETVESKMLNSIIEHLNAEIVLLTITDVSLAISWLKNSYLYVRIKKNPALYDIKQKLTEEQLEGHLKGICLTHVQELANCGLVQTDEDGFTLKPLEPGRIMAQFYLRFTTMRAIVRTPPGAFLEDLIRVLGRADELAWIKLRRSEKKLLNDINNNTSGKIKYHVLDAQGKIKKRIQSDGEKIFVLINDALCGEPTQLDFSMSQDVNSICTNGARIAKCMSLYFLHMRRYKESIAALLLCKCLRQRLWEDSQHLLRQLAGVGPVTTKALLTANVTSFEALRAMEPRKIEHITGRKYPFGNQVKDALDVLPPKVKLELREAPRSSWKPGKQEYEVTISRDSEPRSSSKWHFAHLIVGNEHDNQTVYHERIRLEHFVSPYTVRLAVTSAPGSGRPTIGASVISEEYVGVDAREKLNGTGPALASSSITGAPHSGYAPMELSTLSRDMPTPRAAPRLLTSVSSPPPRPAAASAATAGGSATKNFRLPQGPNGDVPTFELFKDDGDNDDHGNQGSVAGPAEDTRSTQVEACRCRCKDKNHCKHTCCKRNLNWSEKDWQEWHNVLWSATQQTQEPASSQKQGASAPDKNNFRQNKRAPPDDGIFDHIKSKSRSLPAKDGSFLHSLGPSSKTLKTPSFLGANGAHARVSAPPPDRWQQGGTAAGAPSARQSAMQPPPGSCRSILANIVNKQGEIGSASQRGPEAGSGASCFPRSGLTVVGGGNEAWGETALRGKPKLHVPGLANFSLPNFRSSGAPRAPSLTGEQGGGPLQRDMQSGSTPASSRAAAAAGMHSSAAREQNAHRDSQQWWLQDPTLDADQGQDEEMRSFCHGVPSKLDSRGSGAGACLDTHVDAIASGVTESREQAGEPLSSFFSSIFESSPPVATAPPAAPPAAVRLGRLPASPPTIGPTQQRDSLDVFFDYASRLPERQGQQEKTSCSEHDASVGAGDAALGAAPMFGSFFDEILTQPAGQQASLDLPSKGPTQTSLFSFES